jgi:hypothetical protein
MIERSFIDSHFHEQCDLEECAVLFPRLARVSAARMISRVRVGVIVSHYFLQLTIEDCAL